MDVYQKLETGITDTAEITSPIDKGPNRCSLRLTSVAMAAAMAEGVAEGMGQRCIVTRAYGALQNLHPVSIRSYIAHALPLLMACNLRLGAVTHLSMMITGSTGLVHL